MNDWIRPVIYDKDPLQKQKIENMPKFDFSNISPEEISLNHFEPDFLTYYPNANYPFYDDEVNHILNKIYKSSDNNKSKLIYI